MKLVFGMGQMGSNVEQKIGKYEVLTKIGEGGMGVVYKAKDPLIDRIVAIKMMTGAFAEEKESRERFLREARAVGKLQHPNIVTIYELGVEGNSPYMVMEFLEGQGLDKILGARVALTMVQKLDYMAQICNALHYAHEHDIVHRDVKPANVIVMKGGTQVKLVDFGIARAGNSGMTKTGFAIGTTSYMSPEQIEASKGLDRRSDIFSAGVMMYEVLTNNLPFPGTEPIAIAIKILREPYPRLAAYLDEYPPELDDIMARALAKDRDERYSTAEEFAFDLSRLIDQQKREMVSQYVVEGRESFNKKDLTRAKELLSYVLKIDPANSEARQLVYEIQKIAQLQQKGEHLRQLKAAIEETIGQRQYDEALNFIEQALKLDTNGAELLKQKDLVLAEQQRRSEVKKRLNLAQSAEALGDFRLAREHVEKALSLDPTDTQARIVKANIEQALAEQQKQKQIRELLDVAKSEMVEHRFTSAREAIKRAEALQPDSPEIQALKAAAYSAHEQELKRRELEHLAKEVQAMLAADDPDSAVRKANAALQMYPSDVTLLQLRSTAEQQRAEKAERERVEKLKKEQLQKAKDALGRKNYEAASAMLETARIEFPADTEIADLLRYAREEEAAARAAAERATAAKLAAVSAAAAAAEAAARKKAAEERQRAEEKQRLEAAEEKQRAEERQRREAAEEKRRAEEKQRREAAAAAAAAEAARTPKVEPQPLSATTVFQAPSAGAAPAPSAYEETVVGPAPARRPDVQEKPREKERAEKVAPVVAPLPSSSGKMIGIGAAIAVLVIGAGSYFVFHKSTPKAPAETTTRTEAAPAPAPTAPATPPGPAAPVLGTLSVEAKDDKGANLDAADVFVDNQLKDVQVKGGKATLQLATGTHKVRIEKPGFGAAPEQTVEIAKSGEVQVKFALTRTGEEAKPVNPYLMVTSTPGATIKVDNKTIENVGPDGKYSFQVDPGRHKVEIAMRGFKPFSTSINAKAGDRVPVQGVLAAIPPPTVDFSATSNNIQEGQSTELKWSTQGATEVTIEGLGTVPASGSRSVSPRSNTTYTLVAKGEGEPTTRAVTVNVAAVPAPAIGSFAATSSTIAKGDKTRLTWATQNANDVSISGIGKVEANGSREVSPSDTTTYKLTAKGAGGSVESQPVRITVEAPKAIAAATPTLPPANPDIALATAAVDSFKSAYESKNLNALITAWPTMNSRQREAIGSSFKESSFKFVFNCQAPTVTGDNAQATCTEAVSSGGRPQTIQITLDLQKAASGWHVANLRARQ